MLFISCKSVYIFDMLSFYKIFLKNPRLYKYDFVTWYYKTDSTKKTQKFSATVTYNKTTKLTLIKQFISKKNICLIFL